MSERGWLDAFDKFVGEFQGVPTTELMRRADCIVGPLRVDYEPREEMAMRGDDGKFAPNHPRIAVKSGPFTLFTVGEYWDGSLDGLAARLTLVCRLVNEAKCRSGGAGTE